MEREKFHSKEIFINKLRRLMESLEQDKDYSIQIKSKRISVPSSAKMSVEYEESEGSKELEFQLKWGKEEE